MYALRCILVRAYETAPLHDSRQASGGPVHVAARSRNRRKGIRHELHADHEERAICAGGHRPSGH